jgi:oligoribonuclease (3'-5' exoribonuclease)
MTKEKQINDIKSAIADIYQNRHATNRRYCRTALDDIRECIKLIRYYTAQ